jgi:uncharacterized protein (DUF2342 family)
MDYQTQRALILQRTLGTRCAAGYLRNHGVPLRQAVTILLGATVRERQVRRAVQMDQDLAYCVAMQ